MILAAIILLPALFGFGKKFTEFLALLGDNEGSFAIMPVLNYLLASLGFLMLLGWAIGHGMFHDMEKPKIDMLNREAELDAQEEELEETYHE